MELVPTTNTEQRRIAYAIRLRVFVDEQGVPLDEEIDAHDETDAEHVLIYDGEIAVGTGRLVPMGRTAKIGRFAVDKVARGRGLGAHLVRHFIASAAGRFDAIVLDAQTQVIPFYERLGFVAEGAVFDDAGIPHRHMRRRLGSVDQCLKRRTAGHEPSDLHTILDTVPDTDAVDGDER